MDKEHKDKDIKIRYSQAVRKEDDFNENDNIKFCELPEVKWVCIYHKES